METRSRVRMRRITGRETYLSERKKSSQFRPAPLPLPRKSSPSRLEEAGAGVLAARPKTRLRVGVPWLDVRAEVSASGRV